MKSSSVNARSADLNSIHKFPWKWWLKDLPSIKKNGLKVFSCFSCGGGSSMGYKLAGYEILGNCEIDPDMMKVYKQNNHPKHSFLMDVRDFLKMPDEELPPEIFDLDILDGSPPCSVFSTAGKREDGWGVEKVFREGQEKQRLDDLFFWFIDIARRLQPKVVIAENVTGLLKGNAKGYVNEIIKAFDMAGYRVQLFKLDASLMGVPQKRERVFFVAQRKDMNFPKLSLHFNEEPILFGAVRSETGIPPRDGPFKELLKVRIRSDMTIGDINERINGKVTGFGNPIMHDDKVAQTLVSGRAAYRFYDGAALSRSDFICIQTFPQDYDFMDQQPKYVCGMSVPPVMMAQLASQIAEQWLLHE